MDEIRALSYDDRARAPVLSKVFNYLYTVEAVINMPKPQDLIVGVEDKLMLKESVGEIIHYILKKLNPNNSTGPDDLSPRGFERSVMGQPFRG